MTPPLEHDYIGLTEASAADETSDKVSSTDDRGDSAALNLKETELRLGLPGSASPERVVGLTFGLLPKSFVSGAKRVFSDAIDEASQWDFSGGSGSEVDLGKAGLFLPMKGDNGSGKLQGTVSAAKDAGGGAVKAAPAAKAQVVGWPPIRSYRKNTMALNPSKNKEDAEGKQGSECLYIKVSMDEAPYLRKVDLKTFNNYRALSSALEMMFTCFTIGQCGSHGIQGREGLSKSRMMDLLQGSGYVLTYEDKDGDWMLVGDVPWEMFSDSCRRLRIMKCSDAIGIAPRAMEKFKSRD